MARTRSQTQSPNDDDDGMDVDQVSDGGEEPSRVEGEEDGSQPNRPRKRARPEAAPEERNPNKIAKTKAKGTPRSKTDNKKSQNPAGGDVESSADIRTIEAQLKKLTSELAALKDRNRQLEKALSNKNGSGKTASSGGKSAGASGQGSGRSGMEPDTPGSSPNGFVRRDQYSIAAQSAKRENSDAVKFLHEAATELSAWANGTRVIQPNLLLQRLNDLRIFMDKCDEVQFSDASAVLLRAMVDSDKMAQRVKQGAHPHRDQLAAVLSRDKAPASVDELIIALGAGLKAFNMNANLVSYRVEQGFFLPVVYLDVFYTWVLACGRLHEAEAMPECIMQWVNGLTPELRMVAMSNPEFFQSLGIAAQWKERNVRDFYLKAQGFSNLYGALHGLYLPDAVLSLRGVVLLGESPRQTAATVAAIRTPEDQQKLVDQIATQVANKMNLKERAFHKAGQKFAKPPTYNQTHYVNPQLNKAARSQLKQTESPAKQKPRVDKHAGICKTCKNSGLDPNHDWKTCKKSVAYKQQQQEQKRQVEVVSDQFNRLSVHDMESGN